ncbi:MAG: hypothetical protein FJZ47_21180 [Candidatus Tectomicrobia bacterium]|uniref:Long-chain fatty acid transport protein n=1 Tax=Tectimicrobiota bacterium TaxID=2528274 RepID=A0A937W6W0_UNCTE|nr:hypothetical protein [Candidatus Tectomicrobia bacterium]
MRYLWTTILCLLVPSIAVAQQLPFGISLPPSLNFATSPSPVGSGARAVGKALAFIAVADDATAASHNPGGLAQLERPEVSLVGSYFVRYETQDVFRPDTIVGDQTLQAFDLNYLSAAYPFRLLQRNVFVSVNFQRLFDLQSATDVASRFRSIDGIQRVNSRQRGGLYTISPAVAVQVTPTFSLGAAFNIWPRLFGNGWEQDVFVRGDGRVVSGNRIVPFTSQGQIREEYDFQAFNVTTGFLWNINALFSLGGVIRAPFTADLNHSHRSVITVTLLDGSAPVTAGPLRFTEHLDMRFPIAYGLGASARLSDQLTISLDVSRIHWSDFRLETSRRSEVLLVENGAPSGKGRAVLHGGADDATTVRLGAEYLWVQPKLVVPFRAGVFYDPEPGAGKPDDFYGFSLGSGLAIDQFVLDIAYTFRTGTVQSEATNTGVSQHSILASVIYHF